LRGSKLELSSGQDRLNSSIVDRNSSVGKFIWEAKSRSVSDWKGATLDLTVAFQLLISSNLLSKTA
jgi:hypothetical protein